MLILGLLGMYFDAAVVFVTKSSLLFKLAVAILCNLPEPTHSQIILTKYLPWIVQSVKFWKFFSIFPKNDSTDLGSLKDKLICNLEIMLLESKLSKTVVS